MPRPLAVVYGRKVPLTNLIIKTEKFNIKHANTNNNKLIYVYLTIYSIISFLTLTKFPLVHSDEAWLAGLSNNYMNLGTIFVSEPFFDLVPRTIHSIKSLYHILQLPFIVTLGYSITSVRLLSLFAAILALLFFYKLLIVQNISHINCLIYTILLSLNLQFVYTSHFARQEMLLFMILCASLYIYTKEAYKTNKITYKTIRNLSIIIGISIGLHPNAFIIAFMIGLLLLKDLITSKVTYKQLLLFVLILAGFASFHILISLWANPEFF